MRRMTVPRRRLLMAKNVGQVRSRTRGSADAENGPDRAGPAAPKPARGQSLPLGSRSECRATARSFGRPGVWAAKAQPSPVSLPKGCRHIPPDESAVGRSDTPPYRLFIVSTSLISPGLLRLGQTRPGSQGAVGFVSRAQDSSSPSRNSGTKGAVRARRVVRIPRS